RVLVAVYGIFALAATARASVQLLTKFEQAPLAYLLSAVAGLIYIVATITLARGTRASRRVALIAIIIELIGVVTVGTLSVVDPEAFPRATVWSVYGIGYGFVPLVLPILGLALLWHTRPITSLGCAEASSVHTPKIIRGKDSQLDVVGEMHWPHGYAQLLSCHGEAVCPAAICDVHWV